MLWPLWLYMLLKEIFVYQTVDSDKPVKASVNSYKRLGPAGLALHYANIISQIDTLVSSWLHLTSIIVALLLLFCALLSLFLLLTFVIVQEYHLLIY